MSISASMPLDGQDRLVARTHVARFGDESAVVVDRYDRQVTEKGVTRVHQEDVCQALGVPPTRKYQNEGGPGPADIAALFSRVMPDTGDIRALGRDLPARLTDLIAERAKRCTQFLTLPAVNGGDC